MVGAELAAAPSLVLVMVEPFIHCLGINQEDEWATVAQRLVILRPVGDGMKSQAHDADLTWMTVISESCYQLVPFKPHRFEDLRSNAAQILFGGEANIP
ncbi:TPA: hypothetical protein ACSP1Y_004467, partial [Aeromonas hydrophila]